MSKRKPTDKQLQRRLRSFKFKHAGLESWFYLTDDGCSFHQETKDSQHNVFGVRVSLLIRALEACGYIPKQRRGKP